ncbi:parallel beta-helix repeat-containing protein [Fibrisoma limi BUZ 3]|uniref:Parallel beta-helix repeat-containing protein n=1 Tax=Fibrisoma limi BUZ 3 TaxID=1185876 RepID=I2GHP9_9BACT|nr:Ig-like domain-containing protein [Fibrisoma limi]CCH53424.1 parallel beta-helix repeat-containing protein [Fibrisoma limi BUZ 3]
MKALAMALVVTAGITTHVFCQALSVNLNYPQFNSSYLAGKTITIQATATTPPGTSITKVEFFYSVDFSGSYTKIGDDTSAPYSINWTAPSVTTAKSYQIRAVVTNSAATSAGQSGVGYNGITLYPTDYTSTRNWYVSQTASPTNTQGTEDFPFNTIQKAADKAAPGDIIFVKTGTYTSTSSDIVSIRRTGTPAQPIIIKPYGTDSPKLQMGDTNWNAFNVLPGAAYVTIQGFEIIGNSSNITLAQAQAQPGACEGSSPSATPIPRFNGNGISVNGRSGGMNRPHHIVIADNNVHDCAGAGISAIESDYITIERNSTSYNSWYTVYGTSGISVFNSWNYDNSTTAPRIIIRRNRSFGNMLKVAWNIGGTGTNCRFYDGNGIILDNNRANDPTNTSVQKNPLGAYTGKFQVENNVCYQNGGRGININFSDNASVINNTTYRNGQSDGGSGIGIENELIVLGSLGTRVYNNIFYGKAGETPTSVSGGSTVQHNNNLTFGGANNGYFTTAQNLVGQDPLFSNAANGNFWLSKVPLSPAINKGSNVQGQFTPNDFYGTSRPQSLSADIGAFEITGVAARMAAELLPETGLQVTLLENPVQDDAVIVQVSGGDGQPLRLLLTDVQGQSITDQRTTLKSHSTQYRLPLNQHRGILLLQVSTDLEKKSIRILRQ